MQYSKVFILLSSVLLQSFNQVCTIVSFYPDFLDIFFEPENSRFNIQNGEIVIDIFYQKMSVLSREGDEDSNIASRKCTIEETTRF